MKYKSILLIFLILTICLSIQSISAENVTDTLEIESYSDEIDAVSNDESQEILSDSNQEELSEINSDPLPNIETGVVSGGVDFTHIHPWAPSDAVNGNNGNITYQIPANANIKSAYVYVNIYSGSGGSNYGAYANTTLITSNGQNFLGSEYLWTSTSSTNGVKYIVNDHVDRVYSDYMIFYNVTDMLQGLNGTSVSVDVISYPMSGKSFDGRIKLVSLFVAWDDGDSDEIFYWLNAGQAWTDDVENGISHTFDNIPDIDFSQKQSILRNLGVSSSDALYLINGMVFFPESENDEYISGAYYQYHQWDVSNYVEPGSLEVGYKAVSGAYGPSYKNIISILTIQDIPTYTDEEAQIILTPEFSETPSVYAGTNNTVTIKITTKQGRYTVRLLADGRLVNQTESDLNDGINTLLLTDPTIRDVDEFTVNGVENKKVNYTVEILSNNKLINQSSFILPVLYNGNLGKDLAYPADGITSFLNITVTGDIVIDIQKDTNYISANIVNRIEVWNVALDDNSTIVKSFIYLPYYEFNSKTYIEDKNMFNITFNDENIIPIALYRDQSNLGRSYFSGYGLLVYDVTSLIRKGENELILNKKYDTPAVFPSALIYMYNTTQSTSIKEIHIYNGADLLDAISNNAAGRLVHSDTEMIVDSSLTSNATLHIFAAGSQEDEGNLIFNGEEYKNIWNGNTTTYESYSMDITNTLKNVNTISFQATGSRIIALQQIMVLTKKLNNLNISLESEYPDVCYAGTYNYISINVEAVNNNRLTAILLADGNIVNESEIDVVYGHNEFILMDPTIRDADEFTVNGVENKKVNYTLQLMSDNEIIAESSISLSILYNGYLAKDLAYPKESHNSFLNITVNGDVVVDVKDESSYLGDLTLRRSDVWNVNMDDKSAIVKAFIYVPYASLNINLISEDAMFNVKFNNNPISSIASYKDQSNLGRHGQYSYGLLVYEVTDILKNGQNTFELSKDKPTPIVYPSALVYMYNTTGSGVIKNIYISNGADLISKDSHRQVHADSTIKTDKISDLAELYVFTANTQDGEGNIIFNGKIYENTLNRSVYATGLSILDISNTINNDNNLSVVVNDGTILALQQIIVTTQKSPTQITVSPLTILYNTDSTLTISLSEVNGNMISGELTVIFNGNSSLLTTDANGKATLNIPNNLPPKSYDVNISYKGDANHMESVANIQVIIEKIPTQITAADVTTVYETETNLIVTLKDSNGNAVANAKLSINFNGKTTEVNTNANGQATLAIKSTLVPKTYSATITYAGDDTHIKSTAKANVVIKKASVKLTAKKKTFKAKVKTKKYTVTLKNNKGKVMKKVKLTLKVKGKTVKATTNSKGKATFKIKNLKKKGTFSAKITFKGDKYFNKLTKTVKIKVKK